MKLNKKWIIILLCLSLSGCSEGEAGGGFWSSLTGAMAGSMVGNAISNKLSNNKKA